MRRICTEIDLHIVPMLVMLAPAVCWSWWLLPVPLLVPQGRIFARAFWDYPSFGQPAWPYFVANELLVIASVGLVAALQVGFGTERVEGGILPESTKLLR